MLKFTKRVREIGHKHSSLTGSINNSKNWQTTQFESALERDLIYILEFDSEVLSFTEQPVTIRFTDDLRKRNYTPDILVRYNDKFRKDEIIEIKYKKELTDKKIKFKNKFEAARLFAIENEMIFRIITEDYIRDKRSGLLANAKFLSLYRSYFDILNNVKSINVTTDLSHKILDALRGERELSIYDLVSQVDKEVNKKAEILFLTWYLIANNYIACDLEIELTMQSKVWMERLWI